MPYAQPGYRSSQLMTTILQTGRMVSACADKDSANMDEGLPTGERPSAGV
jgi:hypothetical protein